MEKEQFVELQNLAKQNRTLNRIGIALSRAAATAARRELDPTRPWTWQFRGFSQNNEDGIIDYLCDRIKEPTRYFIEIGCSTGLENNTSWLAFGRRFMGLMVEGDPDAARQAKAIVQGECYGVRVESVFVTKETMPEVLAMAAHRDPDVLSLDIDGMDFYAAEVLLEAGFRPSALVLEYNAAFGPDLSVTLPYTPDFRRHDFHDSGFYHGVSVSGWRRFLSRYGYQFLTVEENGANAFFTLPERFEASFLRNIQGVGYMNSRYRRCLAQLEWQEQFAAIAALPLLEITADGFPGRTLPGRDLV